MRSGLAPAERPVRQGHVVSAVTIAGAAALCACLASATVTTDRAARRRAGLLLDSRGPVGGPSGLSGPAVRAARRLRELWQAWARRARLVLRRFPARWSGTPARGVGPGWPGQHVGGHGMVGPVRNPWRGSGGLGGTDARGGRAVGERSESTNLGPGGNRLGKVGSVAPQFRGGAGRLRGAEVGGPGGQGRIVSAGPGGEGRQRHPGRADADDRSRVQGPGRAGRFGPGRLEAAHWGGWRPAEDPGTGVRGPEGAEARGRGGLKLVASASGDGPSRSGRKACSGGGAAVGGSGPGGVPGPSGGTRPGPGLIVGLGRNTWRLPGTAGPQWLAVPIGLLVAVMTRSLLPAGAGFVAVPLVRRAVCRRAARAAADRAAAAVCALCGTVAGDLRAGRPPHAALADALEAADWLRTPALAGAARLVLSAARFGGDVGHALRAAARLGSGLSGLAAVAACWQVAVDGGAGLAEALDRVAMALRAEADRADDLRAQLAGPRSTAVLLALLPAFGLVLGTALGAAPAKVLLHTPVGMMCLVSGVFLEWAGLAWTARIVRAAEGRPS